MGNTHSKKLKKNFTSTRHVAATSKDSTITNTLTTTLSITTEEITSNDEINNSHVLTVSPQQERYPNIIHTNSTSLPPSPTSSNPSNYKDNLTVEALIYHGRKYKNYTKYVFPMDDQEQDRLVQVHFIYKYIFGGNFSAPVRDLLSGPYQEQPVKRNSAESSNWVVENIPPPRVLDIACGNGTWILEMATEFPDSQFYGIDFVPNYPTTVKPGNTFFSLHDVLNPKGLPYPDNYFDYVFMRQVYICFSEVDWTIVVKEIRRVVKPGGYVEFRDIDPILKNMGPITKRLFKRFPELMREKQGVDPFWSRYMFDYLQDVGDMTDMHRQVDALRFGSSGPIGDMIHNSLRSGLESYRLFFESGYNMPSTEYDKIINEIVQESIRYHSFFNYYTCWGRKPLFDYDTSSTSRRYSSFSNGNPSTASPNNGCSLSRQSSKLMRHTSGNSSSAKTKDVTDDNNDNLKKNENNHHHGRKFSIFPWDLDQEENAEVASLGVENVSDIDQFVEGFED